MANELIERDITCELWREYDFQGRIYRIEKPLKLFTHNNSTTHRVLDTHGIVHCIPAPGILGCAIRWQSSDPKKSCTF